MKNLMPHTLIQIHQNPYGAWVVNWVDKHNTNCLTGFSSEQKANTFVKTLGH